MQSKLRTLFFVSPSIAFLLYTLVQWVSNPELTQMQLLFYMMQQHGTTMIAVLILQVMLLIARLALPDA